MILEESNQHQKHPKFARPDMGNFGRNELGFLGTSCQRIQQLARDIIKDLCTNYRLAYVDADHKEGDKLMAGEGEENSLMQYPGTQELRDKIVYKRLDINQSTTSVYDQRQWLVKQDLVLVNANHFHAKCQILIIDPDKTLEKKLDKLTDVQLILLKGEAKGIPDLVKNHIQAVDSVPCYHLDDTPKIIEFIEQWMKARIPPVNGLVLAGGKSTRMRMDKSSLEYHGKSQREHTVGLLEPYAEAVFLSCSQEQRLEFEGQFPVISDKMLGIGPFGGLISAFMENPDVAWLVLACDLPFLTKKTLDYLVAHRNPSKLATAFLDPKGEFPEPLITLWEPRAYPVLYQFLSQGFSCLRKVLINSDIELLKAPDPAEFRNINFPEEYREAAAALRNRS